MAPTLSRARTAWICVAALACGPSLVDEPTTFTGTAELSTGVLCGDDEIGVGDQAWVKFEIRHGAAIVPDWKGELLTVKGATVTRRAAGRPVANADGSGHRFETYWVTPASDAKPGDRVTVGPLSVPFGRAGAPNRVHTSARCTLTVD